MSISLHGVCFVPLCDRRVFQSESVTHQQGGALFGFMTSELIGFVLEAACDKPTHEQPGKCQKSRIKLHPFYHLL